MSSHFSGMQVNRTASYSPSYTANYGEVQQSRSKSATKVTYNHTPEPNSDRAQATPAKIDPKLVQKVVGQLLNARA